MASTRDQRPAASPRNCRRGRRQPRHRPADPSQPHPPCGMHVVLQSENGILGTGPTPSRTTSTPTSSTPQGDGHPCSPAASDSRSATSLGMIRGGDIDVAILARCRCRHRRPCQLDHPRQDGQGHGRSDGPRPRRQARHRHDGARRQRRHPQDPRPLHLPLTGRSGRPADHHRPRRHRHHPRRARPHRAARHHPPTKCEPRPAPPCSRGSPALTTAVRSTQPARDRGGRRPGHHGSRDRLRPGAVGRPCAA